tara:strand:+ start:2055 stop:2465 length:411 start_codon:yes stop_codon:yes gene_type:complete
MFLINRKTLRNNKINIEKYNSLKAHEEMVIKSRGGLYHLFEELENKDSIIETLIQQIARLNIEIYNLENKITQLGISYKFQNCFIHFEINRFLFIEKIEKIKIFYYFWYIFNVIKIKNIIILLNLCFLINNFIKII